MVGSFDRLAAAAVLCLIAAGCSTAPSTYGDFGRSYSDGGRIEPSAPQQCVPYARDLSHIALYGDAYTWWDQAAGRYERSSTPSEGAVMVLYGYSGPQRAHLAVVTRIVSDRMIRVDHANWLDDGAVYTDNAVKDVSDDNDWSEVLVFNIRNHSWGTRHYPVQGFIEPRPDALQLAGSAPAHNRPATSPTADRSADDSPDDEPSANRPQDDPIAGLLANDPLVSGGNSRGKPTP